MVPEVFTYNSCLHRLFWNGKTVKISDGFTNPGGESSKPFCDEWGPVSRGPRFVIPKASRSGPVEVDMHTIQWAEQIALHETEWEEADSRQGSLSC